MKALLFSIFISLFVSTAFAEEQMDTVTVKRGETLMDVSFRYYGTHTRWSKIYEWNKSVIANPNRLEVGTVLKVKPKSETAAVTNAPAVVSVTAVQPAAVTPTPVQVATPVAPTPKVSKGSAGPAMKVTSTSKHEGPTTRLEALTEMELPR